MKIAIAACAAQPDLSPSNTCYRDSLAAQGADVSVLRWNNSPFDEFLAQDLIVLRQTWDYQADPGGFAAWLMRIAALGANVEPAPWLPIWNNDKRTLVEFEAAGVDTPQTLRLNRDRWRAALAVFASDQIVLKPAFGGDGVGVAVTSKAGIPDTLKQLGVTIPGRPMMAQEFLPEIADGEWKMTCIEGSVALAIRATPRDGEFRINGRFGPTIDVLEPPQAARDAAERIMAFVGSPLCGRVDGVMRGDRFICTEVELCDPDLHLRLAPHVADQLASATLKRARAGIAPAPS